MLMAVIAANEATATVNHTHDIQYQAEHLQDNVKSHLFHQNVRDVVPQAGIHGRGHWEPAQDVQVPQRT